MNFKKINKQLSKIKSLVENIAEDDKVSAIEQHLLQSYVRDLYELTLMSDTNVLEEKTMVKSSPKVIIQQVAAKSLDEIALPQTAAVKEAIEPQVVQAPVKEAPRSTESIPQSTPVATPTPAPTSTPTPVVLEAPTPISAPAEPVQVSIASPTLSPEIEALFAENKMDELSDRFSMMPIKDLTKSMGINEKIFTIQELFGGSQDKYNTIMEKLNGFNNFDEAKNYLAQGAAKEFDWVNENKLRKAQKLINLIKRRYF